MYIYLKGLVMFWGFRGLGRENKCTAAKPYWRGLVMISSMFCKTTWSAWVISNIRMNGCHTYDWVHVIYMNESMCQYTYVTRMNELKWHPWMSMFCTSSWSARVMYIYEWIDVGDMNELVSHIWMSPCVTIHVSHLWKIRHDTHECRCSARIDLLESCRTYEWGDVVHMNKLMSQTWINWRHTYASVHVL